MGQTLWAIADELHRRGIASPRGGERWRRSVIQRVLTNRRCLGDWTWGVHASGKRHRYGKNGLRTTHRARRGHVVNPPDEWLVRPDTHEALMDRDVFERVQATLLGNRTNTTPHVNGGSFVLSRLLACGHCGAFLVGLTDHGHRAYVCGAYLAHGKGYCQRNRVGEKPMVDLLLRKLQEAFLDPDNLRRLREEMAAVTATQRGAGNLDRLRKATAGLERKIRQGNERLFILPPDRLAGAVEALRSWERELEAVRAELRKAEDQSPGRRPGTPDSGGRRAVVEPAKRRGGPGRPATAATVPRDGGAGRAALDPREGRQNHPLEAGPRGDCPPNHRRTFRVVSIGRPTTLLTLPSTTRTYGSSFS